MRAILILALIGCAHPTEALLTVSNADLDVGVDLDSVEIEVRAAGALLSSATVPICASGCKRFPFTVLFVPGDHPDTRALVRVSALLGTSEVLADAFTLSFVRDTTLRLELVLYKRCLTSRCADQGQVCGSDGSCGPLGMEPSLDSGTDDAAANPDLTDVDLVPGPRRVFLTKAAKFGNFGGVAGGNMWCNMEATAAGLPPNFVAILGDSAQPPKVRIVLDGGARPIVRPDGKLVATDDTFWEPVHTNPIDVAADGTAVAPSGNLSQNAWTGFDYTGANAGGNCNNWSDVPNGEIGDPYGTVMTPTGAWAAYAAQGNCTSNYPCHIYCIEQ